MNSPDSVSVARPRGWWRRNLWGLLALPVLLLGLPGLNAGLLYERNVTLMPREPIPGTIGHPVQYADAQLRLVSLEQVEPTVEIVGRGHTLGPGLAIWRSVMAVEAHPESTISSAQIELEDAEGRRYRNAPSELHGLNSFSIIGLAPDTLDKPRPNPYTSTSYFVLPEGIRPVALRITYDPELPRFVRFAVP